MNFFVNIFFLLILFLAVFCNFSYTQESYLIKKKINQNDSISPIQELPSIKIEKQETIKKEEGISDKKQKSIPESTKEITNDILKENVGIKDERHLILKNKNFKVIYKPSQINLNQEDIIKIIDISNNLNKESILTIKSYASKNNSQGSSEVRRKSLSRALEVRSLFIENEFPATNILVKALGSEKNNEGFTDIVIVEIN